MAALVGPLRSRGAGRTAGGRLGTAVVLAVLLAGAAWVTGAFPKAEIGDLGRLAADFWPAGEHIPLNMALSVVALCLGAALIVVCDSLGLEVMRWLGFRRPKGAARLASAFVSYILAGTFLLGMALSGLWYRSAIVGLAIIMLVSALRRIPESVLSAASWLGTWWDGLGTPAKALAVLAAVSLSPLILSPEIYVDSMEYHLALPQQILNRHRMFADGIYEAWAYPMAADLPNVFGLVFGIDPAVKVLRPAFLLLGGMGLFLALRLPAAVGGGLGLVWLAALIPSGRFTLLTAKNDAILCGVLLVMCGLILELAARVSPSRPGTSSGAGIRGIFLIGILAGAAVAMKYVAFPFAAALLVLALVLVPAAVRSRLVLPLLAAAALPAVWGVKNYLYFGDPLHPFGIMAFPGLAPDTASAEMMRRTWAVYTGNPEQGILSGGAAVIAGEIFVLAAGLVFMFRRGIPAGTGWVLGAWFAALLAVAVAVNGNLALTQRFGYPAFVAVNMVALAVVADGLRAARRPIALLAAAVLFMALGVVFQARLIAAAAGFSPCATAAAWASGRYTGEAFRERALCSYGAILPRLREAAAGVKGRDSVLCVGGLMTWGIRGKAKVKWLAPFSIWKAARETDSPERLAVRFRQEGARWILYNALLANWYRLNEFPDAWSPRMAENYAAFASRHFEPAVFSGRVDPPSFGSLWLIGVRDKPAEKSRPVFFLPAAESIFTKAGFWAVHGEYGRAAAELRRIKRILPGVVSIDALLSNSLLGAGEVGEAYSLARSSVESGLIYDGNMLVWAIAAARTGKEAEARRLFRRAIGFYPVWPEQVLRAYSLSGLADERE